jgi:uncharacterized protein YceH (UPF0502 family)
MPSEMIRMPIINEYEDRIKSLEQRIVALEQALDALLKKLGV